MKQILLIEDTDSDAEAIQRALNFAAVANPLKRIASGTEAMIYLSGAEATAAIGPPVPSVLLIDLHLPGVSGFEILEYVRRRPIFAGSLRIVLSHFGDTESLKRAYALGAHSFLSKPLQQADLRELFTAFSGYWSFTVGPGHNAPGTTLGPAALSKPPLDNSGATGKADEPPPR